SIGGGVPFRVVDTVQDANDAVGTCSEVRIQAMSAKRRADFPSVRRAYGRDTMRMADALAQTIDGPARSRIGRQHPAKVVADVIERFGSEDALIADVVNRRDRARLREQPIPRVSALEQQRHEARMPVVAVD